MKNKKLHKNWEQFKEDLLKDSQTKKAYDGLELRYQVISQLIGLRIRLGLTQAELAEKVGMHQSAIARLESGNVNPSLNLLERIANATGSRITIHLES